MYINLSDLTLSQKIVVWVAYPLIMNVFLLIRENIFARAFGTCFTRYILSLISSAPDSASNVDITVALIRPQAKIHHLI